MKYILSVWWLIFFQGMATAQVTVGWGVECDYDMTQNTTALQLAIDSGATEVRLSNQNPYLTSVEIENQIVLKGGYSTCSEAEVDSQVHSNAVINAAGFGLHALKIRGIENADILIDSIDLINGEDSGLQLIANDGTITLNDVKISDSTGESAGGVYVYNYQTTQTPQALTVVMIATVINNNEAVYFGGGLSCQSTSGNVPINLQISGGTVFHSNQANYRGGGLHLNGCDMDYTAANNTSINNGDSEIYNNTSVDSGGGLSIQDAEVNLLGDVFEAFNLSSNEAGDLQNSNMSGGGLFAVGNSDVTLINAYVIGNKAQEYGAGLYTSIGSKVAMDIAEGGCHYDEFCSKLQNNQLEGSVAYGAAVAATGGEMSVKQTLIQFNKSSEFGYVAHARNDAQLMFEGNLILDNGSTDGSNAYYGFHVQGTGTMFFHYNTTYSNLLTGNLIELSGNSSLYMIGNIVDEYADILHTVVGVSTEINCNMLSQTNNITVPMTDTIVDTVEFIDPSTFGNYRLVESSTNAMDVCSDVSFSPGNDLSNSQRGLDNPDVMNVNGLFDLGAYEFNPNWDVIFADSFD